MKEFKNYMKKISSPLIIFIAIMISNLFKMELDYAIKFCLLYLLILSVLVFVGYFIYKIILKNKKDK